MVLVLQMQAGTLLLKKTTVADSRSGCICYSPLCKAALCATLCVLCPNSPEISLKTNFSHRFTAGRSFAHQRAAHQSLLPAPFTQSSQHPLYHFFCIWVGWVIHCYQKDFGLCLKVWFSSHQQLDQCFGERTVPSPFQVTFTFRSSSLPTDINEYLCACQVFRIVMLQME